MSGLRCRPESVVGTRSCQSQLIANQSQLIASQSQLISSIWATWQAGECSEDDIKVAFRKLALKLHPDKQQSKSTDDQSKSTEQANEKFLKVQTAYEVCGIGKLTRLKSTTLGRQSVCRTSVHRT